MPDGTALAGAASTAVADTTGSDGGATETETATPTEGAGGEGAEGGAEGTGEGGDEAGGEGDAGGGSDEDALQSIETDGRRVDEKTRSALAKLAAIDKDAARKVREAYFRDQALIKDLGVKNVSEAQQAIRQMRATLDSLGGDEGITALQEEVGDYRKEIQQFAEGDPALLSQLYEASPEGLVTSTANALELIASKDPKLFDQTILPAMVSRMKKAGWYDSVPQLLELIKEGKGQEAYDLTTSIQKWMTDAEKAVQKNIELKTQKNPEKEKLDARARELDEREARNYDQSISVDVNKISMRATSIAGT